MEPKVDISHLIDHFLETRAVSSGAAALLKRLRSGATDREAVWEGVVEDKDVERDLAAFIVHVISYMLADHHLSDDEIATLTWVRYVLRADEGELVAYQREAVKDLIHAEMTVMLSDARVEDSEALFQADLQRALGLGYDEFLSL